MNITHIDIGPAIYGFLIFLGLWIVAWKVSKSYWFSIACDLVVFVLVFKMHGGTMTGGFAATIAAAFAGLTFPALIRRGLKQWT